MHIQTIKTRLMMPPQDDLYDVLGESIPSLAEGSILVITSKLVAIHQGRCLPKTTEHDDPVRHQESVYYIVRSPSTWFAIRDHMLMPYGGVDTLGPDYWVLPPADANEAAREIQRWLAGRFDVERLGVIVTDSVIWPMRRGTIGVSLGHAGFCPVYLTADQPDLFGNFNNYPYVNQVDTLAAAAVMMMGEKNEQTPLALITDVPFVSFGDCPGGLPAFYIPPERDPYAPLLTGRKWKRGALAPPRVGLWSRVRRWLSGYVWRYRQWRKGRKA